VFVGVQTSVASFEQCPVSAQASATQPELYIELCGSQRQRSAQYTPFSSPQGLRAQPRAMRVVSFGSACVPVAFVIAAARSQRQPSGQAGAPTSSHSMSRHSPVSVQT
jgi:hypothetical protein